MPSTVYQPECEDGLGESSYKYSMAKSLHYSPETITTLLISYTPIQNVFGANKKKLIKLKRKKFVGGSL